MELLPFALLVLAFVVGLTLIPFGLPGTWLMVLALVVYAIATDFMRVGTITLGAALLLATTGELLEWWLGFRFARQYGGSTRAGWGAIAGGIVGALIGTPVPVIGNIVGAFLGAFVGAAALEHTRMRDVRSSVSAGWGAVLGRAAAAAAKVALGLIIAIVGGYAALTA